MARSALRPIALTLAAFCVGGAAHAAPYAVKAFDNSSSGATGMFKLYDRDSNNGDNFGEINANVNVAGVPEPETYALMPTGLGALGFIARRRGPG